MGKMISPPPSTIRSNSEIWSRVYANDNRGNKINEKFFSGDGSHNEKLIIPYINTLLKLLMDNNIRNIVDLGCGDFWIMRQVLGILDENKYSYFYTGIDVTEELIKYNTERFKAKNKRFIYMDATADDASLPNGDILIIRQVLQHLRNEDIEKVLSKTTRFKFLFITEHIYDATDAVYNADKTINDNSIRLSYKSGIYLERAPFNFKHIVHLLKVPSNVGGNGIPGTLRSSLIIN